MQRDGQMADSAATLDPWQFRIEAGAGTFQIGDYGLTVGPDLPVTPVIDRDGTPAGFLLGFAIDLHAGHEIIQTWQTPDHADLATDDGILATLMALGGRFIWICTTRETPRIYLDVAGQIPCVFDTATKIAGASATAILTKGAYQDRFDRALYDHLKVDGEGWFPGALTAHTGITRLLPNHFLDLATWETHRFWWGATGKDLGTPDKIVDEIIALIQTQIAALVAGPKRPIFGLTAGYETRAMLACAKPFLDDVDFVTITGNDRHHIDGVTAVKISQDFHLNHRAIPRVTAADAQRDTYLRRVGHCNGDSNARYHPSVASLMPDHVFISGVGGETARASYWREADTAETILTPEILIRRFGLPRTSKIEARLQDWLDNLQCQNAFVALDLLYMEHRIAPWSSVQFTGDPTLVRHAPMFCYRTVALMQALPQDWKRQNKLAPAIIAKLWPALADYPYNSLGPLRDFWVKIRRVLDDPRLVLKKLRQKQG